jgi:serine/threonine-protein kinase RsbW
LHIRIPEYVFRKESMSEEMKAQCQLDAEHTKQDRAALSGSQPFRPASFVGLRSTLPAAFKIVSPFVNHITRFISRFRVGDEGNFEIELALREALVNAIVHGNGEDPNKRIYVHCRCTTDGEVSITVEDEGNGFEQEAGPNPTSPDNRQRTNDRGIHLIRTLMDDVYVEQGGSVVGMRKRANAGSDTVRKPQ